jgi:hypothetical protein
MFKNLFTVEPVPNPITFDSSIYFNASSAAAIFPISIIILLKNDFFL